MGKIAGAFGQGHILFNDANAEEGARVVFDGYKYVGETVRDLDPDLMVVVSDDHMFNIHSGVQAPLSVGVADQYRPMGDMDVPTDRLFPGHRDFGEGLVRYAADHGFDLAKLEQEGFRPDHGVMIPVMFSSPHGTIPHVPIMVNINMEPPPSPRRCWDLGRVLREYIEERRPADEKVVIIGTGGLSHWLMVERDGEINVDWDKEVLDMFAGGRAEDLSRLTADDIVEVAGNGGLEITCWLVMAGAVPDTKGKILFYEPMHSWKTGMGAVEMNI